MENQPSRPDQDRPETPDSHQPYQPVEPDTPDIQDPIIDGDNAIQNQQRDQQRGADFSGSSSAGRDPKASSSGLGRAPEENREFVEGAIPPLGGDTSLNSNASSGAGNANQSGSNKDVPSQGNGSNKSGRFGTNGGFGSDDLASKSGSREERDSGLGSDSSVGHDLDADEDTGSSPSGSSGV